MNQITDEELKSIKFDNKEDLFNGYIFLSMSFIKEISPQIDNLLELSRKISDEKVEYEIINFMSHLTRLISIFTRLFEITCELEEQSKGEA